MKDIIKLGQIVGNDHVEKQAKGVVWSLDRTLAIVIRDYLRQLADITDGYPDVYDEDWNLVDGGADVELNSLERWTNHLKEIADKFDYYLKDTKSLLDKEDRDFLDYFHAEYPIKYTEVKVEGGTYYSIGRVGLGEEKSTEDEERYEEIMKKERELDKSRASTVQEALSDLGKIFPHLWD